MLTPGRWLGAGRSILLDETHNVAVIVFLVLHVHSRQFHLLVEYLHSGHLLSLLLPIVLLQDLALFWRGPLQTLNHQSAAVLDVCADLTCHAGVPKEIKGNHLRSERTTPSRQDLLGIGILLLPINATPYAWQQLQEGKVVSCLVLDNRLIPLFCESAKIHIALGAVMRSQRSVRSQFDKNSAGRLNQVQVIGLLLTVHLLAS